MQPKTPTKHSEIPSWINYFSGKKKKKPPLIVKRNLFLLLLMFHLKTEFNFWGNRYQSDSASGKNKISLFPIYLLSQGVFLMCFNDNNYVFHAGVKSLQIFAAASAALCSDQGKFLSREAFRLWEAHRWKSACGFGCTDMIPIIPLKWVIKIFSNISSSYYVNKWLSEYFT